MAGISSGALEKQLSVAMENYHQWWQPVDEVLYDLCERKPSHDDETISSVRRTRESPVLAGWRFWT